LPARSVLLLAWAHCRWALERAHPEAAFFGSRAGPMLCSGLRHWVISGLTSGGWLLSWLAVGEL
jgi:hypothetical protein